MCKGEGPGGGYLLHNATPHSYEYKWHLSNGSIYSIPKEPRFMKIWAIFWWSESIYLIVTKEETTSN